MASTVLVLDPALAWLARAALALLFASSAAHKLRDPAAFRAALRNYRVLSERLVPAAAGLVIAAELAAAVALLVGPESALGTESGAVPGTVLGPAFALALLGVYSIAVGLNLARGRRHIDCGCLGPGRRQSIAPWMLMRNALLGAPALLLALAPPGARALSWIDAVSIGGGLAIAALTWSAVHQLASAPGLRPPLADPAPESSA